MAEHEAIDPGQRLEGLEARVLAAPPGTLVVPRYEDGWVLGNGRREAYLSYTEGDLSVNWSAELEALHQEASRTHFIDRWTRSAIVGRVGSLPPGATIVDVGCSSGYLLEDLCVAYPAVTVFGIDLIATGLVKAHRDVPRARLVQADARALPLTDSSTNAIVSANLLEHVRDDLGVLREFFRILVGAGRAVIVVPAGRSAYDYYDRFLGHERRYAHGELASKCRTVGFDVLENVYIGSLLYPAFWLLKQRNRRCGDALRGAALEARVAADIARTHHSRIGELVWRLEHRMARAGLRLPFGIRSLVVVRRPEVG